LILIRHAKSSWDAPFDDHARTLNDRGRKAATQVGHWLRKEGHVPDTIYASDAARTRETTDRVVAAHNPGIAIFAGDMVSHAPDHPRFFDYPTGATLVCDFAINDWAEAVPRSGQVVDFIVPKDLSD